MKGSRRTWGILKICLAISGLIVLFFSGILPIEDILTYAPHNSLTASVIPAMVAELTNENRTENGLKPLTVNPVLSAAAQMKAEDMAKNGYYAHISPDGKTPLYWLQQAGYKYLNAGENLVIDRNTSGEVVSAWMNSPDHRDNILRPQFTEVGIGVASGEYDGIKTIFVVQEFGTPYPLSISNAITKTKATVHNAEVALKSAGTSTATAKPAPQKTSTAVVPTLSSNIATYATPIVQNLTVNKPVKATTTFVATSTIAAASTTFTFTLSPEFFAPVTVAATQIVTRQEAPQAVTIARPNILHSFTQYLQSISSSMRAIF